MDSSSTADEADIQPDSVPQDADGGGEKTPDSTPVDQEGPKNDLSRAEHLGLMASKSPDTAQMIYNKWTNGEVEVYFLMYSISFAIISTYLLWKTHMQLLVLVFVMYAITAAPVLYLFQQETYFENDPDRDHWFSQSTEDEDAKSDTAEQPETETDSE